jgi:hypothetical protein
MILILVFLDRTADIQFFFRHFKRTRHIISIDGEVQTFLRDHEWKVGLLVFVVVWVSMVVSIEKTILSNSVIHNGPRFTASFGQVCANFTIHSHLHALSENVYSFFLFSQLGSLSPLSIST